MWYTLDPVKPGEMHMHSNSSVLAASLFATARGAIWKCGDLDSCGYQAPERLYWDSAVSTVWALWRNAQRTPGQSDLMASSHNLCAILSGHRVYEPHLWLPELFSVPPCTRNWSTQSDIPLLMYMKTCSFVGSRSNIPALNILQNTAKYERDERVPFAHSCISTESE